MKERPILFSGAMVNAIQAGRKTQTRRMVKLQANGRVKESGSRRNWHLDDPDAVLACPYGKKGDRLWVKETFSRIHEGLLQSLDPDPDDGTPFNNGWSTVFRANNVPKNWEQYGVKWKPSIFMSRKLSRILLEIVSVRVERLQEITEEDAVAEGLIKLPATRRYVISRGDQYFGMAGKSAVRVYELLWESIHGAGAWAKNPWVWVVEFKVVPATAGGGGSAGAFALPGEVSRG